MKKEKGERGEVEEKQEGEREREEEGGGERGEQEEGEQEEEGEEEEERELSVEQKCCCYLGPEEQSPPAPSLLFLTSLLSLEHLLSSP